jgi:flavin-dependent dehydrogenase
MGETSECDDAEAPGAAHRSIEVDLESFATHDGTAPHRAGPRDATRGGVNGPARPVQRGRERPLVVDAVIIGGGPAGIACALALHARGLRVVVAERRMRGTRGTPGETLPGRARGVLEQFGAADLLDDWSCLPVQSHRARWGPALRERNLMFDPHGPGWQIDRDRFDEALRDHAVDRGIDLRLGMRCTSVVPEAGGWRITLDQDRGHSSLRAALVVDATGRSAFVARRLGARRERCDRTIALVAGVLGPAASRSGNLVEVCPAGWWYATTLPTGDVVLNLVTDAALVRTSAAGRAAAFLEHLQTAPLIERYLAGCGSPAWLRVVSASPAVTSPMAGDGWLAVGDASAVHDPLAFSGVTKALEDGRTAAASIASWLGGDRSALQRHALAAQLDYRAHLDERRAYYAVAGMARFPFWTARAATVLPASSAGRTTGAPWWPMAMPASRRAADDRARPEPQLAAP